MAGDTHINGRLTLGENTADNGGLRLALMAYLAGPGAQSSDKVDGFTPEQRVFLGWAQVWCENARPEAERLKAATNPHSSNKYRVNGPLVEHAGVPEGVLVQGGRADGAAERVPRVVRSDVTGSSQGASQRRLVWRNVSLARR